MPKTNLNPRYPIVNTGYNNRPLYDLTDIRFGRLLALYPARRNGAYGWFCICDCGKGAIVVTGPLVRNEVHSCGCFRSELAQGEKRKQTLNAHKVTHGLSHKVPEYKVWAGMRSRCLSSNDNSYANYGGRGIQIDPRWSDFAVFYRDMGSRPSPRHQLDRKDNNGPYSPENCRWLIMERQARNRRNNRMLTVKDQTKCLAEWAELLGVSPDTITRRIGWGWTIERAVTTPPKKMPWS